MKRIAALISVPLLLVGGYFGYLWIRLAWEDHTIMKTIMLTPDEKDFRLKSDRENSIFRAKTALRQQADLDEYADALRDINDLIKRFQGWQDGNLADSVAGAELSERDQLATTKPTWKVVLDSCAFTMQQGWDWVADDYSSYLQPWGFDPRDVNVPTVIWQAELDKNVPVQHGKWLAQHMPNNRFELRAGESHLGLYVNYEKEIMQSAIDLLTSS